MLRKSHIITSQAITTGLLMANNTSLPFILTSLCGVWIGAQLPDIDNKRTRINRRSGPLGWLLGKIKHRTWTHTIWAVIILLILAIWCPVPNFLNIKPSSTPLTILTVPIVNNYLKAFLLFIVWGYLLHLFEDNFSHQGVCYFYPISRFKISRKGRPYKNRPFRHYYYRTGGTEEKYIRFTMEIIFVIELILLFIINFCN